MTVEYNENERGERLDDLTAERLRALANQHGTGRAAQLIGIGVEGFARACARLAIYPSTMRKIRRYFQVTR